MPMKPTWARAWARPGPWTGPDPGQGQGPGTGPDPGQGQGPGTRPDPGQGQGPGTGPDPSVIFRNWSIELVFFQK